MITELSSEDMLAEAASCASSPSSRLLHVRPEGSVRFRSRPAVRYSKSAEKGAGVLAAAGCSAWPAKARCSSRHLGRWTDLQRWPSASTAPGRPRFEVPSALPRGHGAQLTSNNTSPNRLHVS